MSLYACNGRYFAEQEPLVPVSTSLVRHGEGWVETLRIEAARPMFCAAHLQRLRRSVQHAGYPVEPALDLVSQTLAAMSVALGSCARGRLRIVLAPVDEAGLTWHCHMVLDPYQPSAEAEARGIEASLVTLPHPGLGALGKSVSYHWSRAARREAQSRGASEALLARDGQLIEAATATVLMLEPQRSPDRWLALGGDQALASVTVACLRESGIVIDSGELSVARLLASPPSVPFGLVLVSAVRLAVAVQRVDDVSLLDLGPQARQLRAVLLAMHA